MISKIIRVISVSLLLLSGTAHAVTDPLLQKNQDSNKPIKITADNLEVLQDQKIAIFTGNVIAIQGDTTLKSEVMKVHYRSHEKGVHDDNSSISQIDVDKNVFMTAPNQTAQGDNGTYDVDHHLFKLNNNVVLTKEKNIIKGDRLEYNTETGKSQVFSNNDKTKKNGRVEGVFIPKKEEDKAKPNVGQ
jgi:lipopolysaccharide export system protein LptA